MYLRGDGIVRRRKIAAISLYARGNGIGSIAIRRNINVPSVQTGNGAVEIYSKHGAIGCCRY